MNPPKPDDNPVGWVPRPGLELVLLFCAGYGDPPGVVGADCGIGGRDSSSAAPKEEDGLNALSPANPVFCGCNGLAEDTEMDGAEDVAVAPVG